MLHLAVKHPQAFSPCTQHRHNQKVSICHLRLEFMCDGAVGLLSLCSSAAFVLANGFVHIPQYRSPVCGNHSAGPFQGLEMHMVSGLVFKVVDEE